MESEFADSARIGEWREEADAGLRGVHSSRPCKESCLSTSLKFPSLTEKTAPSGLGQAKACPYNFAYAAVGLLGLMILFGGVGCKQQKQPAAVLLAAANGKVSLVAMIDPSLESRLNAVDWVKAAAVPVGGGGGGRPTMARAGGKNPEKLDDALAKAEEALRKALA